MPSAYRSSKYIGSSISNGGAILPRSKQIEQTNSEKKPRGVKQARVAAIQRSQINPAPYNPRSISEYARKQLEKSLSEFGLVETLVWNETTGNLVAGHQRLSILDQKRGYPDRCNDYGITVSVVSLDGKQERRLNVWLNNQSAQGHFERDALQDLLNEVDLSLSDIGFTVPDLELEFGSIEGFESILAREEKASDPIKRDIEAIKARKKEVREQNAALADPQDDADYYLMVVFESFDAKEQWLKENHFQPAARFVSYAEFAVASTGLVGDQGGIIQQAIDRVRESEGEPNMKASRAIELIAADFLSGQ